jgi:hypothetical protein
MRFNETRPVTRKSADLGNGLCLAAVLPEHTTTALALKRIYARVAVSEPVALLMARHAGLIREAR